MNEVMNEDIVPEMTDEELDAIVNELPTPTPQAIAVYNAKMEFLHQINKEAGVFQDIEIEPEMTDEIKLANSGKYVDIFNVVQ